MSADIGTRTDGDAAPTIDDGGVPRTARIGVLVVAYNAASTLAQVLDRVPRDFVEDIDEIIVNDDASSDSTYLVGLGYQQVTDDLTIRLVRHPVNLGYGGNQKAGYRDAIADGLDIIVLLHGDGQYAPEMLPDMVAPILDGSADAVFGSRMMESGDARRGGMPTYKYVGNRILTTWENAMAGMELSEWHSGYRAYSVAALADIPFERNSNGFDFDTEIILQLHEAGKRIVEIPIPTYYGDEICHVNGIKYAADVTRTTGRYRLHKMGFGSGELAFASQESYEMKHDPASSHGVILSWLAEQPPRRVLDVGCSDGRLGQHIKALGHHVVGVDHVESDSVRERLDDFVVADLIDGDLDAVSGEYDVIVFGDVLEHLRTPERLLANSTRLLAPGGSVIASVPNFAHWYPRIRSALGLFDYDQRGILDRTHLRFFTRRSFERLVQRAGYSVVRRTATGLPFEVADRGALEPTRRQGPGAVQTIDRLLTRIRPQLFGYQLIYELKP